MPKPVATARQRAREAIHAEILLAAHDQLTQSGPAALSVRAVARDVGMSSSAIYRYFSSRDELLTALIIAAYNDLADTAEKALDALGDASPEKRFTDVWHAARTWALHHPHDYALIFGSPVPGYAAPLDTIGPATRFPGILLGILADLPGAKPSATSGPRSDHSGLSPQAAWVAPMSQFAPPNIPTGRLTTALTSWEALFGAISFELFGHLHNVIPEEERAEFFDYQIRLMMSIISSAT